MMTNHPSLDTVQKALEELNKQGRSKTIDIPNM